MSKNDQERINESLEFLYQAIELVKTNQNPLGELEQALAILEVEYSDG